jgi:hypothetical protein
MTIFLFSRSTTVRSSSYSIVHGGKTIDAPKIMNFLESSYDITGTPRVDGNTSCVQLGVRNDSIDSGVHIFQASMNFRARARYCSRVTNIVLVVLVKGIASGCILKGRVSGVAMVLRKLEDLVGSYTPKFSVRRSEWSSWRTLVFLAADTVQLSFHSACPVWFLGRQKGTLPALLLAIA